MTAHEPRVPIRILLVEDHTFVREGTRRLLEAEPDLLVVGEAAGGAEAVRLVQQLLPDVVLLDLRLDGHRSGLIVAEQILRIAPSAATLALTGIDDPEYARAALKVGLRGYLLKTASAAEIAAAIRQVHLGATVLDSTLAAAVFGPPPRASPLARLTERERTVFRLLGRGASNAQVANELGITVRTAEWHVAQILLKLDLPSRAVAIAEAARAFRSGDGGDSSRR